MDATRALGVASALTLVATLSWQLRSQWKKGTCEGVSRFLFVGQLAASTGFAAYSWAIRDPVFVVTNVATGIAAIVGLAMTVAMRRREHGPGAAGGPWRGGGSVATTAAPGHASLPPRRAGAV